MNDDESNDEILSVVRKFENAAFRREDWRRAEHLTVALHYAFNHDFEIVLIKMRGGIFKLLESLGADLAKEMPYHETLTVFWMRTISDFAKSKNGCSIAEIRNEMIERFGKDYPLEFYSREVLYSNEARKNFIEGDAEKKLS